MSDIDSSIENEFDDPPQGDDQTQGELEDDDFEEAESEWVAPTEGDDEEDAESQGAAIEEDEATDFPEAVLEAHNSIDQQLQVQVQEMESAAYVEEEDVYEGAGNILGVGLGVAEDDPAAMLEPGMGCLNVYVAEACSNDDVCRTLCDSMGIQAATSDDLPVNVIVTGLVEAQPHRFKIRPAPGGVSVGHFRITAGTLGCLARGRRMPRSRRLLMLSNNHVLANSNSARYGDSIIQPGRADGGTSPGDRIAILERFIRINFSGRPNYVDCATGWCWPRRVRRELVYLRRGRRRFFRIGRRAIMCRRGMLVAKSGRTTQLTAGRVVDCNVSIRVNYGRGRVALFRDQISIRGLGRQFSAGGDSGSVIWCLDRRRYPVGLLFAGGGGYTFANKMPRVLSALRISLFT